MSNVEIFENERATHYDQFVSDWISGYQSFIDQLPRLLGDGKERNLLVAGCGTGNEIKAISESKKGWSITGVDPSPEMIAQAKEKLKAHPTIQLKTGLVSDLKTSPKYNAATLILVLHFLEDDGSKLDLLKQIADRLQPEGQFIMLDITGSSWLIQKNLQVLKQLVPDHLDANDIDNRLERIQNELHYVTEERLTELLMLAGFDRPVRFFQSSIYMGWITYKRP